MNTGITRTIINWLLTPCLFNVVGDEDSGGGTEPETTTNEQPSGNDQSPEATRAERLTQALLTGSLPSFDKESDEESSDDAPDPSDDNKNAAHKQKDAKDDAQQTDADDGSAPSASTATEKGKSPSPRKIRVSDLPRNTDRNDQKKVVPPTPPLSVLPEIQADHQQTDTSAKAPAENPREKDIASLPAYEQEAVRFLEWAEKKGHAQYTGSSEKYIAYVKRREEKIAALMESDPDATRDEIMNGTDFKNWDSVQERRGNKPVFNVQETRVLRDAMIAERVRDETVKRVRDETVAPLEQRLKRIELEPAIRADAKVSADRIWNSLTESAPKDSPVAQIAAVITEAQKSGKSQQEIAATLDAQFPDETRAMTESLKQTWSTTEAWIRICRGVDQSDPHHNPVHQRIAEKVIEFGRDMLTDPRYSQFTVRDGKRFVPREQFSRLTPEQKRAAFTFTDNEILALLEADGARSTARSISAARKNKDAALISALRARGLTMDDLNGLGKQHANASAKNAEKSGANAQKKATVQPTKNPPKASPSIASGVAGDDSVKDDDVVAHLLRGGA